VKKVILKSEHKTNNISVLIRYIIMTIILIQKNKYDLLFIDNYTSSIAGFVAYMLNKRVFMAVLARELYIDYKMPGLGNIFLKFESKLIKKADIVLARNIERADIMKKHYKLSETPIILENIRRIEKEYDPDEMELKYSGYFTHEINIISAGGLDFERGVGRLILAMKELPNCGLYICGRGTTEAYEQACKIISENQLQNIYIFDKKPLSELRYIMSRCNIGTVEYSQNRLNSIYCASGRLYEYLFEGLPVVTTTNPPLKRLCEKYSIGVSTDDVLCGIKIILSEYDKYRLNVKSFIDSLMNYSVSEQVSSLIMKKYQEKIRYRFMTKKY
jgi:glycosyltransferase involved in cell wall biosynthesis